MLSGLVLALLTLATPHTFQWIAGELVICFLASVAVACWIVSRRILLLGRTLDYLKRVGLGWAFLERHEHYLRAVEQAIYDFFLTRRRIFLAVLGIEIATNFTGIGEAYLILKVTAAHASLFAAYLVESTNRAVQLAFSFVPFGLGIQEGVAAATLQALGYAASEGVSLAIIRKIRIVFWAALGLLLAAKYSMTRPTGEGEHDVAMRQLIVNADDFGLTEQVSRGILDAHHEGIVTSTTLMANGGAFDAAVSLARREFDLGIGVHLNLTESSPVSPAWTFPVSSTAKGAALESSSPGPGHIDPSSQSGRCGNRASAAN